MSELEQIAQFLEERAAEHGTAAAAAGMAKARALDTEARRLAGWAATLRSLVLREAAPAAPKLRQYAQGRAER